MKTAYGLSPNFAERLLAVRAGLLASVLILSFGLRDSEASSGTEGASFLNIPVGARPAALGSAYTALASDAYAPTWNPSGLGRLESTQLAGQHLSYLESIYYEHLSLVQPLGWGRGIGFSVQYLGSGEILETDLSGTDRGHFSAYYGAYSLAYGQSLNDKLSLGITGKIINAKISDVGATAYAFDFGTMYNLSKNLTLAGVLTNVGTKLTFLDQADSLPLAARVGAVYRSAYHLDLSVDGVYRQTGLASVHSGLEWRPASIVALRVGYHTDTLKGLSALAGFTAGIGLDVWGHEFSYAWRPLGDLGNTQYFSAVMRFGAPKRNLIQYQAIRRHRVIDGYQAAVDYGELIQLLESGEKSPLASNPN